VKAYDGEIKMEIKDAQGSEFILLLPL